MKSEDGENRHRRSLWLFALATAAVTTVFCIDSFTRVPIPGINEPHYLCKARAYADPEWCANDFFLQSSNAHAVFYMLVGPLTQWFDFYTVATIGRIISLMLLAVGWTLIARRLQLSLLATIASAALFCGIASTGNLSGEWVVGGFESKVPAYGFALIATALWIDAAQQRRSISYVSAGVFAGLAVAMHPVVGMWFCIGIAMSEVCLRILSRPESPVLRQVQQFGGQLGVFAITSLVVSLPGLWPAAKLVLFHEATAKESLDANLIQVFYRLAHHLDPTTFSKTAWTHTGTLLAIATVGGAIRLRRPSSAEATLADAAESHPTSRDEVDDSQQSANATRCHVTAWTLWMTLLCMSLIIAICGGVVGWHSVPAKEMAMKALRASVLKLYAFRFFDALLPLTVSLLVAAVADSRGRIVSAAFLVVVVVGSFELSQRARQSAPNSFNVSRYEAWQEACAWLEDNTPPDAVIYTPRESFGMKWFAERAEYICFKDCPQDAKGILEWNRRLWAIHHWSQQAYSNKQFDDADLQTLHEKTGVTWLITRRLGPFESQLAFENDVWRIYAVRVNEEKEHE